MANNVITRCFFIGNTDVASPSKDTSLIGTVGNQGHEIKVTDCILTNNIATSARFYGVYGSSVRGYEVNNTLIARNKFKTAVYLNLWDNQYRKPDYYDFDDTLFNFYLSNCTIADNWLSDKAVYYFYSANNGLHGFYDQFLRNCFIIGNHSDEAKTKFSDSQLTYTDSAYTRPWAKATNFVMHCVIDGRMTNVANLTNATATAVYNNHHNYATVTPRFVDPNRGDYSLRSKSVGVNAGMSLSWHDGAYALNFLTFAYDPSRPGVRVFYDSKKPNARQLGVAPDIGAYEFKPKMTVIVVR